jgi:UPF0755 protein
LDSEDLSGATSSTPDITEKSLNRRRTKKKTFSKALVATLVVIAIAAVFLPKVVSFVSGPPDFPGPGNGSVQVQISPGQNLSAIGNTLKALGVVKSVDSFTAAASKNSDSESIAPGAYNLRLKMKSSDAILALLDPINRIVK